MNSKIAKKIKMLVFVFIFLVSSFCIGFPSLVSSSWSGMVGVDMKVVQVKLKSTYNAIVCYVLFKLSIAHLITYRLFC